MPLTKLTQSVDVVQTLSDRPNALDGLDAAQLKAKFDEAANIIKAYLNNVLIPELEAGNIDIIDNYVTKIELSNNRKLSSLGNFTGSWHGIANPTFADPGIANVVNQHSTQLADNTLALITHSSKLVSGLDGVHGFKTEKGTWSPAITGASGGSATMSTNSNGSYVRQGDFVYVQFYAETIDKGNIAGTLEVGGFPFAPFGVSIQDQSTLYVGLSEGITYVANAVSLFGQIGRNTTKATLRFMANDGTAANLSTGNVAAVLKIRGFLTYKIS